MTRTRPKIYFLSALALITLLLTLACSSTASQSQNLLPTLPASENGTLRVVSTVSPITSLVENIGGTRIQLEGVVPEGTNSHSFEPAPSVATVLSNADLFVANGLFLEEPTIEMARANLKPDGVILTLGDQAVSKDEWVFDFSFPESDGHPNPHLWTASRLLQPRTSRAAGESSSNSSARST